MSEQVGNSRPSREVMLSISSLEYNGRSQNAFFFPKTFTR
jgi:CDP-diacylglycerol pyrophosphatase